MKERIKQWWNNFKTFDWKMYLALCLLALVPAIYQTVVTKLITDTIQKAIAEAGFEPRIMSQVETNNWIMPEIFYQIKNCRFVVADFSLPCDGAYYEAGYAAALDKPVIHLFDRREETETNKLHFDIAQKSTIFYNDFDELRTRLINRIKATIK